MFENILHARKYYQIIKLCPHASQKAFKVDGKIRQALFSTVCNKARTVGHNFTIRHMLVRFFIAIK
jgi:hypothetical protein